MAALRNGSCSLLKALLTGLLAFAPAGFAQSTFGTFVGTIHDPSGGVVTACKVTAENTATAAKRSATTDAKGTYSIVNLEPGTYEITMEMPGFNEAVFRNMDPQSRETVRVDGLLTIGSQNSSVSVSTMSEAPISTEVSNIAESKLGRELTDLPVAIGSRASGSTNAFTTLTTQPGVEIDNSGNLSVAGSSRACCG